MNNISESDWLVADIDGDIVNFGMATRSAAPVLHNVRHYSTADYPTATDAFNAYAKDVGIVLQGRQCGLAVSGAIAGDTVRIQRCRWIISKMGLRYLFGSPPLIVNDSVAKCWTNLADKSASVNHLGGDTLVDYTKPGKWVTINYNRGLGAAVLVKMDDMPMLAMESECGHTGFSPQDGLEREIAAFLSLSIPRVTNERMLFIKADDPLWDKLSRPTSHEQRQEVRAAVLGAFAGDMVLAFAGWSGVYLHGENCAFMASGRYSEIFNRRFEEKGNFRATVKSTPRFLSHYGDDNLQGICQMMAHRFEGAVQ